MCPLSAVIKGGRSRALIANETGLVATQFNPDDSDVSVIGVWASVPGVYTDNSNYFDDYVALALPDTDMGIGGVSLASISKSGNLIGGGIYYTDSEWRAYVWKNSLPTDITPDFDPETFRLNFAGANFVNEAGTMAIGELQGYIIDPEDTLISIYTRQAFRWTETSGSVLLPNLDGDTYGSFFGMTPDGAVIVGSSSNGFSDYRAVYWSSDNAIHDIHPEFEDRSEAFLVSVDGSVIGLVGYSDMDEGPETVRSYRWTQTGGAVSLGTLGRGDDESVRMDDMSADGSVLVGTSEIYGSVFGSNRAVRWTAADGLEEVLPDTFVNSSSYAQRVSRDGSVTVGSYRNLAGETRVFRADSVGAVSLTPDLDDTVESVPKEDRVDIQFRAMTPTASVIVGQVYAGEDDDEFDSGVAFYWSASSGLISVEEWLVESGVELPEGFEGFDSAEGISDDGTIVVGSIGRGTTYIARAGSGAIDPVAATASVVEMARGVAAARTSANLVMSGAHGHPMSRRAETGRWLTWGGGDLGTDDHGSRDGGLSVLEGGVGYNFGPAQLNVALGRTDASQNTDFGGETEHVGRFAIADVIVPVQGTDFWITFTGLWHESEVDVTRGYLNLGLPTSSAGETDTITYAGALRVDWNEAYKSDGLALTPFAKIVLSHGKVDAFTETTGPFPAAYGKVTDTLTDAHLGVDGSYALSEKLRLVATLEGVHRFQESSSSTSFAIPGVIAGGSAPGAAYKQTWLSGGGGAEYDVGAGTFSLTVNASTESPASSLWVASSYRYQF